MDIDYENLSNAVRAMQLQNGAVRPEEDATRAIWLGGIPASTTTSSLKVIFEKFGKIDSVRVLTHKGCGFINFEALESAVRARAALNGTEIFPGSGPVRIGYAKTLSGTATPGYDKDGSNGVQEGESDVQLPHLQHMTGELLEISNELGATAQDHPRILELLSRAAPTEFTQPIPSAPEPSQVRLFDAPRLREIRKRIDNQACSAQEIEETAHQMLPEIAELSSDYLGNTVVQKLFENCSEPTKEAMLGEIAPHIAEIGVHKNGTWAAQKIIDVAYTPQQRQMIVDGLRPHTVASFQDQYGNYVVQCCLKFAAPNNDFIFECMLSNLWKLAEARFGARAMRACLESHFATKDHQRVVAAAIALHSVQLAANANGALLLTWYLDTCTFKNRRKVLAPRLTPHLVQLCTHKVAYMTVLKLVNQRDEPEARQMILRALFLSEDEEILESILKDQSCGATMIYKVLTTPFFDEDLRSEVLDNVRSVLTKIKAQSNQGYKRLMDEVGLSSKAPGRDSAASPKKGRGHNSMPSDGGMNGAYAQPQYNPHMNGGMPTFEPFSPNGMNGQVYANSMPSPIVHHSPMQYQQHQFNQSRPQNGAYPFPQQIHRHPNSHQQPMIPAISPMSPMNGMNGFPPMQGNPYMPRQGPMMPQGNFSPVMGMGMQPNWGQYAGPYMMPQGQGQGQMNMGMPMQPPNAQASNGHGGRRGRQR